MNRRTFTKTISASVVGNALSPSKEFLSHAAPAHKDDLKPSDAAFQLSVMLWTVFTDLPFEQRLEKVAEAGFRNVELVGEYGKWTDDDFKRANAKRKELGMHFDCTAGLKHGIGNPSQREALLAELRAALPIMERIDCPSMILLSGNRVPSLTREAQHQACIEALQAAATIIEGKFIHGEPIRLFLETIDPEENPQYFLTEIVEALAVVQAVNHPQVKLLYDFYHEQIAAGNLIAKLEKSIHHLGLVHIADVPGRHQPGTGEINYANIFRKLAELNYTGVIAMEFHPSGDPVTQLRSAREMAIEAGRKILH